MPTDPKTVRAYDAHAPEYADRAALGKNTAHDFLEKPALMARIPKLKGKRVLLLGVGSGAECTEYLEQHLASLVATDISAGLVAEGRKRYPGVDFRVMDMEKLELPDESFDLVVSSLALHYLPSWKEVLREVRRVLVPHGEFLFSTHHPLTWASETVRETGKRSRVLGYAKYSDGRGEPIGNYLESRPVSDQLFNTIDVTYYHRPFSALMSDLLASGMVIKEVAEPLPTYEAHEKHPAFAKIHSKIPLFLIVHLLKNKAS